MRCLRAKLGSDPLLTSAYRLQMEPVLSDLEGVAPGAADKLHATGARLAQRPRQLRKLPRVAPKHVGFLVSLDRPAH